MATSEGSFLVEEEYMGRNHIQYWVTGPGLPRMDHGSLAFANKSDAESLAKLFGEVFAAGLEAGKKRAMLWLERRDISPHIHPAMAGLLEKYLTATEVELAEWTSKMGRREGKGEERT